MKLLGKRNRSCFNNKELPLCAWEDGWSGGGAFGITPSSDDLSMHCGWTLLLSAKEPKIQKFQAVNRLDHSFTFGG